MESRENTEQMQGEAIPCLNFQSRKRGERGRRGGEGTVPDLPCLLKVNVRFEKMTKLEDHLEGIINVFHQYSVRVGDFDTLNKRELKQLITKELANTIKVGDAHHGELPPSTPLHLEDSGKD